MAKPTAVKVIELTLSDRINLPSILKEEGNYEFLIIKKSIKNKVAVSELELEKYNIKTVSDGEQKSWITWNKEGAEAKFNYDFSELEKNEIKLALKKLSEDNKLNDVTLSLYEKFVN
jgi:hypothetical protein